MIETVADGSLDQFGGFRRGQSFLGLALEFRIADEDGDQRARAAEHVFRRDQIGLLDVGRFGIGAQTLGERTSQTGLVGPTWGVGTVLQ